MGEVMIRLMRLKQDHPAMKDVQAINDEAFPVEERMSIAEMFTFPSETQVLGFFQKSVLVGFALVLLHANTVFVVLLAIDKRFRGNGFGSQALRLIKENYYRRQIVLDFECIREDAGNYKRRVKRKQFYLNNGFYETGLFTVLDGERYEVVCSEEELHVNDLKVILHAIHLHTPEFEEALYR